MARRARRARREGRGGASLPECNQFGAEWIDPSRASEVTQRLSERSEGQRRSLGSRLGSARVSSCGSGLDWSFVGLRWDWALPCEGTVGAMPTSIVVWCGGVVGVRAAVGWVRVGRVLVGRVRVGRRWVVLVTVACWERLRATGCLRGGRRERRGGCGGGSGDGGGDGGGEGGGGGRRSRWCVERRQRIKRQQVLRRE